MRDGSYYGKQYRDYVIKGKRLIPDLYDENLPVNIAMDLGMNDTMVLIFYQRYREQLRLIDEYHNSGEGLDHYADVIFERKRSKGYEYDNIHGPHDMAVRDLSAKEGKSRKKIMRGYGVHVKILPKQKFTDGIATGRNWMKHLYIDDSLTYIKDMYVNYSKEWDDKLGGWKDKHKHDDWSNPGDAYRYVCQAAEEGEEAGRNRSRSQSNRDFDV